MFYILLLQATNEDSLKQLYAYIDGLRAQQQQVQPIDLKFYVRNHGQEEQEETPSKKTSVALNNSLFTFAYQVHFLHQLAVQYLRMHSLWHRINYIKIHKFSTSHFT